LDRPTLRKIFYGLALGASGGQLLVGPLVLFTLPVQGLTGFLYLVIALGVVLGIGAMVLMWREIVTPHSHWQVRFLVVVALITGTAFAMGYGRHLYREQAVAEHRRLLAVQTREFGWDSAAAQWRAATGVGLVQVPLGQRIFQGTCSACHALAKVLVGPSLQEIAHLYGEDTAGIVSWTTNPGKKRSGFPQMPAFRLPQENLEAVAEYMLEQGSGSAPAPDAEAREPGGPAPELPTQG
jgi:cytochrome c